MAVREQEMAGSATLPLMMNVREAAKASGIGINRLYDLVRQGEVPHRRIGGKIYIPRMAFVRWVNCEAEYPQPVVGDSLE